MHSNVLNFLIVFLIVVSSRIGGLIHTHDYSFLTVLKNKFYSRKPSNSSSCVEGFNSFQSLDDLTTYLVTLQQNNEISFTFVEKFIIDQVLYNEDVKKFIGSCYKKNINICTHDWIRNKDDIIALSICTRLHQILVNSLYLKKGYVVVMNIEYIPGTNNDIDSERMKKLEEDLQQPCIGINNERGCLTSLHNLNLNVSHTDSNSRKLSTTWLLKFGPKSISMLYFDIRHMPKEYWISFIAAYYQFFNYIIEAHLGEIEDAKILHASFRLFIPVIEIGSQDIRYMTEWTKLNDILEKNQEIFDYKQLTPEICLSEEPEALRFIQRTFQSDPTVSETYLPKEILIIKSRETEYKFHLGDDIYPHNVKYQGEYQELEIILTIKAGDVSKNIYISKIVTDEYRAIIHFDVEGVVNDNIVPALVKIEALLIDYGWKGCLVTVNLSGYDKPTDIVNFFFKYEKMFTGLPNLWSVKYCLKIKIMCPGLHEKLELINFGHVEITTDDGNYYECRTYAIGKYLHMRKEVQIDYGLPVGTKVNMQVSNEGGGDLWLRKESALKFAILVYNVLKSYPKTEDIHVLYIGNAYSQELRLIFEVINEMDCQTNQSILERISFTCLEKDEHAFKENAKILKRENPWWINKVDFQNQDFEDIQGHSLKFRLVCFHIKSSRVVNLNFFHLIHRLNPTADVITYFSNIDFGFGKLRFSGRENQSFKSFSLFIGDRQAGEEIVINMIRYKMKSNQRLVSDCCCIKVAEFFKTTIDRINLRLLEKRFGKTRESYNINPKEIPIAVRSTSIPLTMFPFQLNACMSRLAVVEKIYALLEAWVDMLFFQTILTKTLSVMRFTSDLPVDKWYFSLGANSFQPLDRQTALKKLDEQQY